MKEDPEEQVKILLEFIDSMSMRDVFKTWSEVRKRRIAEEKKQNDELAGTRGAK
jgi:hypothetical protein